jgi:uncharacterized protein (DUF1697 family)
VPIHIALLRAVNVGGTGKLPMADFRALCVALGLQDVQTYIQSGNLVARSPLGAPKVKQALEGALAKRLGKPCQVVLRSPAQLQAALEALPFPDAAPNRVLVVLLDAPPPADALQGWKIPGREELRLIGRELFIHFPDGMGKSRLKVPFADSGTGRNLNTLRALLAMASAMG